MMLHRQDLDRLSWIASNKKFDSWALVLRVQAELFASVCTHDRASIAAFESLALAIIPRICDEAAADAMRVLADTPEAPATVIAALRTRLATAAEAVPASVAEGDARPARGVELQSQVDRARRDPDLARALLASEDLPAAEAARLYLFADRAQRATIRATLAGAGMAGRRPMRLQRPSSEAVAFLLNASDHRDTAAFGARLADCMGLASIPDWRFQLSERHDLLALAVSAIGLCEEDAIRIFLTLVPEIAQSVETVFGLVDIFRRSPRSVSTMILEAGLDLQIVPRGTAEALPRHGQDLVDRAGSTARPGKMPGLREWGRQLRPHMPDKAG
jgi:hypothetical protein